VEGARHLYRDVSRQSLGVHAYGNNIESDLVSVWWQRRDDDVGCAVGQGARWLGRAACDTVLGMLVNMCKCWL
jgi:hypothetical protein